MEEHIVSGYCRAIDQSRMVTVETEGGMFSDVDCGYGGCLYEKSCPIAKTIAKILEKQE